MQFEKSWTKKINYTIENALLLWYSFIIHFHLINFHYFGCFFVSRKMLFNAITWKLHWFQWKISNYFNKIIPQQLRLLVWIRFSRACCFGRRISCIQLNRFDIESVMHWNVKNYTNPIKSIKSNQSIYYQVTLNILKLQNQLIPANRFMVINFHFSHRLLRQING